MKKHFTSNLYALTFSLLWCILMLSACQTSRMNQAVNSSQINITLNENNAPAANSYVSNEQAEVLASIEEQPAAASTRPNIQLQQAVADKIAIQDAPAKVAIAENNAATQVQKKLTLPARMLMKSIAKKAEKLKKKDIQGATEGKEVNNRNYLILGIILLIAGLVAVLVGNTTLLYVLGSVASLLGLVFLLLGIL